MEDSVATTLTTPQTTAVIPDQPMLIGGEWVPALDGSWSDVVSPGHRGTILARVPVGGVADADRAVKAARAAFPAWRAMPFKDRQKALLAIADALQASAEDLTVL